MRTVMMLESQSQCQSGPVQCPVSSVQETDASSRGRRNETRSRFDDRPRGAFSCWSEKCRVTVAPNDTSPRGRGGEAGRVGEGFVVVGEDGIPYRQSVI